MYVSFLLRGIVAGFIIAAPVGPVNVLCMRRTLTRGRRAGFISGLGAATADALYGAVAGFGLKFVSALLLTQHTWLRIVGGLFICALGIKTFLSRPFEKMDPPKRSNHAGAFASTFFLTLTNPTTILSFGAIFAWLGLANAHESFVATHVLILGVFLGSALWWFILAITVGMFRSRLNVYNVRWINRISGIIIVAFGVVAFLLLGS